MTYPITERAQQRSIIQFNENKKKAFFLHFQAKKNYTLQKNLSHTYTRTHFTRPIMNPTSFLPPTSHPTVMMDTKFTSAAFKKLSRYSKSELTKLFEKNLQMLSNQ